MKQTVILIVSIICWGGSGMAQNVDVAAKLGYPEMIVYNAKVLTMDDDSFEPKVGTIAQAMAIRGGKILATGSDGEIRALAGPQTKLINVKGRTIMPGIISTHDHPVDLWVYRDPVAFQRALPNDDVVNARFMDYIPPKEQLAKFEPMMQELVAKAKPGQWIFFRFNQGVDGEWTKELTPLLRNSVKKEWLDQLAPNNPVKVGEGTVNTKAIEDLIAVHPYLKARASNPNFLGLDNVGDGARDFVYMRMFEPDAAFKGTKVSALARLVEAEFELWASYGFTGIGSSAYTTNNFRAISMLDRNGELPVRFGWGYTGPNFDEDTLRYYADMLGHGTDHLWFVGVWERIGSDCSTARVRDEWLKTNRMGARGTRFCEFDPGSEGRKILERIIETGNRVATMHTGGDKDIDNYMDAIEQASKRAGMTLDQIRAKRHAMDHSSNAPRLDQIPRMQNLGMMVSVNSQYIYSGRGQEIADIFGIEYSSWMGPRNGLTQGRVMNTFETDNSMPDKAFHFLQAGVTRISEKDGKAYGPDQKVDRTIMLKAMTRWGAYYLLREKLMGTLEPGKFADFIVLDKDVLTVPENHISDIHVLLTAVGGKIVHLTSSLAGEIGMQAVGPTTWGIQAPRGSW